MENTEGLLFPFMPTKKRQLPPTKLCYEDEDGAKIYTWYITEDEYLRLSKLFGRDFQETGLGGTQVRNLPNPCSGCGKYTEFIDWVWTALQRSVHSKEFIFKALKEKKTGTELSHDIYCSECGKLTTARSINNTEGRAPNIYLAGKLKRTNYPEAKKEKVTPSEPSAPIITWGKWWLDDNGSTASYRASLKAAKAAANR